MGEIEQRDSGKEKDSDSDKIPLKESVRKWTDYEKPVTIHDTHRPPPPRKNGDDDK